MRLHSNADNDEMWADRERTKGSRDRPGQGKSVIINQPLPPAGSPINLGEVMKTLGLAK